MSDPQTAQRGEIHSIGYRPLGPLHRTGKPALAIARTALTLAWRRRATKLALLPPLGAFVVCATILVGLLVVRRTLDSTGSAGVGLLAAQIVGEAGDVLSGFVQFAFFSTAFLLSIVGGGLLADDLKASALDLYFSRPLTRAQYLVGKGLAALAVPTVTLLVPSGLLWLLAVGIADDTLQGGLAALILPTLTPALLATLALTGLMLGVSALSERGATATVTFIAGLLVVEGLGNGLAFSGVEAAGYLAPVLDVRTVAHALNDVGFGIVSQALEGSSRTTNESAWLSALALVGMGVGGLAVAFARIAREVRG